MAGEKFAPEVGWRMFGFSMAALGVAGLVLGDFLPGQPAPKWLAERATLGLAADGLLVATGLAMIWRRTAVWGAGVLAAYYVVVVVLLMDGRMIARNAHVFLAYSNTAEQLALAAGAVIVWARRARVDGRLAARLVRAGQAAFGLSAVLFGGAHFAYMNFTAPLVPHWLPPSQTFWGYATGVFHIAGGLAILTGVWARPAAILLTVMYLAFTPLVHAPQIMAKPWDMGRWIENGTNLALAGAAWVVADSLRKRRAGRLSVPDRDSTLTTSSGEAV